MISTSPIKISCMIARSRDPDAVRELHDAFGLENEPSASSPPREALPLAAESGGDGALPRATRPSSPAPSASSSPSRFAGARACLRSLRAPAAAPRPGRGRAPAHDVPLRPPGLRRGRRHDGRLEPYCRCTTRPPRSPRRCSPRARCSRSSRASHSARRSRTSARACSSHSPSRCASAIGSPSAVRRGSSRRWRSSTRRSSPTTRADVHPEHAADDEHDRQPHDRGPTPRGWQRSFPVTIATPIAEAGARAARGDRRAARDERRARAGPRRRDHREHRLARGRGLRAGRRRRRRARERAARGAASGRYASAGSSRAEEEPGRGLPRHARGR